MNRLDLRRCQQLFYALVRKMLKTSFWIVENGHFIITVIITDHNLGKYKLLSQSKNDY